MTPNLPKPALFVNEDVAKSENRVNLALFSLMLIPPIHAWFLERLGLPARSIVYPPQNVAGGRPDLVVLIPEHTVAAWIEIELGGENNAQLAAYQAMLAEPIKSIVGPETAGGHLTLEEIARVINDQFLPDLDAQQAMSVEIFTTLVSSLAGKPANWNYTPPEDAVRGLPLLRLLQEQLGDMLRYGTPPIAPGTAQVSTITQKGWTLRVFAKAASMGSVGLLWDPSIGKGQLRVPSRERLVRCLPTALSAIDAYVDLLVELGSDIRAIGERQNLAVGERALTLQIDRLADCIQSLATAYGTAPASET